MSPYLPLTGELRTVDGLKREESVFFKSVALVNGTTLRGSTNWTQWLTNNNFTKDNELEEIERWGWIWGWNGG